MQTRLYHTKVDFTTQKSTRVWPAKEGTSRDRDPEHDPAREDPAGDGDNPRSEFDDDQMAELTASVTRHGTITPLTLAPDGDGRFTIIAGERRYRAAKAAKLREVPARAEHRGSSRRAWMTPASTVPAMLL